MAPFCSVETDILMSPCAETKMITTCGANSLIRSCNLVPLMPGMRTSSTMQAGCVPS